jgi:hypothetical protein
VHDELQARAFSIAMKRIAGDHARKPSKHAQETPTRHFNTSRSLKAVHDTSTIDFAFLPDVDSSLESVRTEIRVPILPHIESEDANAMLDHHDIDAEAGGLDETGDSVVMKPQILTVTETLADGAHVDLDLNSHASAMSDVQAGPIQLRGIGPGTCELSTKYGWGSIHSIGTERTSEPARNNRAVRSCRHTGQRSKRDPTGMPFCGSPV